MRLTKDDLDKQIVLLRPREIGKTLIAVAINELREYKSIEEELGIDLVTLIKTLRSGIHIIDDGYPYNDRVSLIYSSGNPCGFKCKVSDHCVFFKDYGKTWALTKEELL